MAGIFMVFIAGLLLLKPSYAPPPDAPSGKSRSSEAVHVFPVLGLLVVVLGSVYSGIATPTEASALGAAGAIVLAVGYRSFTRKVFTNR